MKEIHHYSGLQLTGLVILRMLIGWHLLYEGISKIINPGWTSAGFLSESQWFLSGFADWIISNQSILNFVDFLNIWGLIAIGTGLILGIFTRLAALSGIFLLLLYYLNSAPIVGIEYTAPSEGNYLIVNKTLIEVAAMFVIFIFPASNLIGLDLFFHSLKFKKRKQL